MINNMQEIFKNPNISQGIKAITPTGVFNTISISPTIIPKYDLSNEPPIKDRTLSFLVKNYVNQRSII